MVENLIPESQQIVTRAQAKASGAKLYWTGNPCPNGHTTYRLTINGLCRECGRDRSRERMRKAWIEKPEEMKEKAKARIISDKTKAKNAARFKTWTGANKDKHEEWKKEYYIKNAETIRERMRKYHFDNLDEAAKRSKNWRENNRDKVLINNKLSKARRKTAERNVIFEKITIEDIIKRDGPLCYICGEETFISAAPLTRNKAEIEHVVPLSKGGNHTWDNLKCACFRCNRIKGDRLTPEQTRVRLARMLSRNQNDRASR